MKLHEIHHPGHKQKCKPAPSHRDCDPKHDDDPCKRHLKKNHHKHHPKKKHHC